MILKLVSLNIWNGGKLLDQAISFLNSRQPDIILLQEVYSGTENWFQPRFRTVQQLQAAFSGYQAEFSAVYQDIRAKEGLIDEGQLVLSKFPILDVDHIFLDIPYGQYSQDDWDDFTNFPATFQRSFVKVPTLKQPLRVINVHGPVWYTGAELTDRRQRLLELLQDEIAGARDHQQPLIIGGDFNADYENPIMHQLANQLQPVVPFDQVETTFNMHQKTDPGYATAKVDQIFVNEAFQVLSGKIVQVNVSDHLPVLAGVKILSGFLK